MVAITKRESGMRVMVAGATGNLGRLVVQELRERKIWVRALTRHRRSAEELYANDVVCCDIETGEGLSTAFAGKIDVFISCLGNSLKFVPTSDKSSFHDVDFRLNKTLLDKARTAGVRRFAYVSTFSSPGYADTAFVQAHEAMVEAIRETGMEYTIARPSSLFSSLCHSLDFLRAGSMPLIGTGATLTNPIDDRDLASLMVDAIVSPEQTQDFAAGGPEMFTRREIIEKVLHSCGRDSHFMSFSEEIVNAVPIAPLVRLMDRRLGELVDFYVKVNQSNNVAPPVGKRRLDDYFAEMAKTEQTGDSTQQKIGGGQNWSLHFAPLRRR